MQHISEPLLQAYIDEFCGDARRAEIEAHIASCERCRVRIADARAAAQKASRLLGTLEPGPVHAPSFEELKERAIAQPAGPDKVAAALEAARAATATPEKDKKRSSWHRSGLAWAATIVIAFGLGWLTRSGVDRPADLRARQESVAGVRDEGSGRAASDIAAGEAAQSAPAPREAAELQESVEDVGAGDDRVGNLRTLSAEPAAPAPDPAQQEVARRQAEEVATPASAEERVAELPQAAPLERPFINAQVESEAQGLERNEAAAGRAGFADAAADGFLVVDRDDAELWLGAPLRELSELALLRAEVGPGALVEGGIAGRPAVRSVYRARTGQEIVLLQQYIGPVDQSRLAQVDANFTLKATPAEATERAKRFRSADALTNERADRDRAAAAGLDLPATVREPDGRVTYTWLQPEGYLLSVSAELDADVVRGLADIVR